MFSYQITEKQYFNNIIILKCKFLGFQATKKITICNN